MMFVFVFVLVTVQVTLLVRLHLFVLLYYESLRQIKKIYTDICYVYSYHFVQFKLSKLQSIQPAFQRLLSFRYT